MELYTSEHDGFVGSDKDEFFDCGIHMDEDVVDLDIDIDFFESVQAHPRAGSECEKGDVDVPIFVADDTDPVEKNVTTQDTTHPSKRKRAEDPKTASKKKRSQDATRVATQEATLKAKSRSGKCKASKKAPVASPAPSRTTRSSSKVQEAPSAPTTSSRFPRTTTKVPVSPSYPRYALRKPNMTICFLMSV